MVNRSAVHSTIQYLIDETFNKGNVGVVDGIFTDDYVNSDGNMGRDVYKQDALDLRTAFPDLRVNVSNITVEGSWVAFHLHLTGTFGGVFHTAQGDLPPTHRPIAYAVNIFMRLTEDGKIDQEWDYFDALTLMMQLGAIPLPASGAPPLPQAPTPDSAAAAQGDVGANHATFSRLLDEALNSGHPENAAPFVTPNYVHHSPGVAFDFAGWKNNLAGIFAALPDLQFTPETVVAEGNRVAVRLTARGRFTGTLMMPDGSTLPGNNKRIELPIGVIYRLNEAGQLVAAWERYDQLVLLTQLGVLPAS